MPPTATVLLRAALAPAVVALSLLTPSAALADPPEGCIGFPSIPEAFVCIDQWSPENAVPTVAPGPGQTVTVPEFCVFECFGPTPVTVPNFVVTQGDGVIAKITYNGTTHTVAVPPLGDPNQTIAQAVQTINDAVATVLGIVENAGDLVMDTFTATASYNCYGCGFTSASLSGLFSGTINGRPYTNASMSAWFNAATDCALSGSASGNITIGDQSASFSWTQFGDTLSISFSGGFSGTATAVHRITSPAGNPCGTSASASITGVASIP